MIEAVNRILGFKNNPKSSRSKKQKERVKKIAEFMTKFMVYGCVGIFFEVSNYTTFRILGSVPIIKIFFHPWEVDQRLNLKVIWDTPIHTFFGMTSLWMFLVFGLGPILVVEPLYRYFKKKRTHMILRGLAYSAGLLIFEFISGHILNFITGYDIWIYTDALSFKTTSLSLVFLWFLIGLFTEHIYRRIIGYDIVQKSIKRKRATYKKKEKEITTPGVVGNLNEFNESMICSVEAPAGAAAPSEE